MKRYPAWQALYRSFFHADFYRDVASNWKGLGFLYLFLLAGVSSLLMSLVMFFLLAQFCDKHLLPIADQFPTITAANDKYSIDRPSPYIIKDNMFGDAITFDSSGTTKTLDHPGILVTDEAILIVQPKPGSLDRNELEAKPIFPASGAKGTFGKAEARNCVLMIRNFLPLIVFAALWFFGTIFNLLQGLLYGAFGLISNSILKTQLTYLQLVRLAALAMTPPMLLNMVLKPIFLMNPFVASPYNGPFLEPGISFIVSMIYLFIGIQACKTLLWTTESPFPSTASASASPAPSAAAGGEAFQEVHPATQPEQSSPTSDSPEQPPTS